MDNRTFLQNAIVAVVLVGLAIYFNRAGNSWAAGMALTAFIALWRRSGRAGDDPPGGGLAPAGTAPLILLILGLTACSDLPHDLTLLRIETAPRQRAAHVPMGTAITPITSITDTACTELGGSTTGCIHDFGAAQQVHVRAIAATSTVTLQLVRWDTTTAKWWPHPCTWTVDSALISGRSWVRCSVDPGNYYYHLLKSGAGTLTSAHIDLVSVEASWEGSIEPQASGGGGLAAVSVTAPLAGDGTSGSPLNMAVASDSVPGYMAAADHALLPSSGQKLALVGSSGTPGAGNVYVTDADPRMTNSRTPSAHADSHKAGGSDPLLAAPGAIGGTTPAAITGTVIVSGTRVETPTIGTGSGTQHALPSGTADLVATDSVRLPPTPSAAGKMLYDTGAAYAAIAAGTSTQVLHGAAAGSPTWGAVVLSTDVSGTLPVGNLPAGDGWACDGSDGDVTISSNTSLSRAMCYNNLTIQSGFTLYLAGHALFVYGTLTVESTATIAYFTGSAASGATAGSAGPSSTQFGQGGAGATGGTGAGATAATISGAIAVGGTGGTGLGGANAGGSGGTASAAAASLGSSRQASAMYTGNYDGSTTQLRGGTGGGAGGAGGGDQSSGGGGGGCGVMMIAADIVANSGAITCPGGAGGNGVGTNAGGGGGGAGGHLAVFARSRSGAGTCTAPGGAGGTPTGTGTAGSTGSAGVAHCNMRLGG